MLFNIGDTFYNKIYKILEYNIQLRVVFYISIIFTLLNNILVKTTILNTSISIIILSVLEFIDYQNKKYYKKFGEILKIHRIHLKFF